jgi:hypothetical protein
MDMDSYLCLDVLSKHARRYGSLSEKRKESQCEKNPGAFQADANPVIGLAGRDIALKFAQQAANMLSQEEFTHLVKFLESPKTVFNGDLQQLQPKVTAALEEFYSNETVI